MLVILQRSNSSESRCIRKLSMVKDNLNLIECDLADINKHTDHFINGAIPVGSVEFVNRVIELLKIPYYGFNSLDLIKFPIEFYRRNISIGNKSELNESPIFIKPVTTKLFSGFIYRGDNINSYSSEYELEQYNIFKNIPYDLLIYQSDLISIQAEWRCYITNGKVISICQYDDSVDDKVPSSKFISDCLKYIKTETLALDIGQLKNGKYVIIELNDAFAIGKYNGISDSDYFEFIKNRWNELYAK